jgi:hypothetical protein
MSSTVQSLAPVILSDKDKLRGYENYGHWKMLMEAHGGPKGLHKYWHNKINIPDACANLEDAEDKEDDDFLKTDKPTATASTAAATTAKTTTAERPTATPLHSSSPLKAKYELRESVAILLIIINMMDVYRSGVDPTQKSHLAWALLEAQYGKANNCARNMCEEALANCRMMEGGKVTRKDGHIGKMQTLRQAANEAGTKINDARFITKLLDLFPESWDLVITPMYSELDLGKIITSLNIHAE